MHVLLGRLVIVVGLVTGFGVTIPAGGAAVAAGAAPPCGTVLLQGSSWLGASGVPVYSNGAQQHTGVSCGRESYSNPGIQDGNAWQCVELAARLYYVKGWGTVRTGGNGGATYIPEGSPSLAFHTNGTGYIPVPGDLIIFKPTSTNAYGHVAVVDSVGAGAVNEVEENASTTGRATLTISGSTISGNVRGIEHSPKNTNTATGNGSHHGDFNGDGKTDLAYQDPNSTSIRVLTSGGTSVAAASVFAGGMGMSAWRVAGDFNGDGKTDLLYQDPGSTNFYLLTSNGSGFSNQVFASGMGQPAWEAA